MEKNKLVLCKSFDSMFAALKKLTDLDIVLFAESKNREGILI